MENTARVTDGPSPASTEDDLVFEDPVSLRLLARVEKVAAREATVLIEGETGTGKEVVARFIHRRSPRSSQPFIAVNCGALSSSLIESELFGHERGAFTGAMVSRAGWFEEAHGGTLFLDEIGELPLPSQAMLLRVLQEREVVRLGSRRHVQLDVRLVAATNVDLEAAVSAGQFRKDLFYRLAVTSFWLPLLRERPGDILPLARRFLKTHGQRTGNVPKLSAAAERELLDRPWDGNVRELENAIQHALVVAQSAEILAQDLPPVRRPARVPNELVTSTPSNADPRALLRASLDRFFDARPRQLWKEIEAEVIRSAFEHESGNQLRTARLLGVGRNVVRARLQALGLLASPPPSP